MLPQLYAHREQLADVERELDTGHAAHAYLVFGPSRAGKGFFALHLAHLLAGFSDAEAGESVDLKVLAAPGIEDVRDLAAFFAIGPAISERRLAVIEDVDAVSVPAQNALLKTLEEPPRASALVLTASNGRRLLPTIASRCRRLSIGALPVDVLATGLSEVAGCPLEEARATARSSHGLRGWAAALLATPDWASEQKKRLAAVSGLARASLDQRFAWAKEVTDAESARQWLAIIEEWWRDVLMVALGEPQRCLHRDFLEELQADARAGTAACLSFLEHVLAAREALEHQARLTLVIENLLLYLP